MTNEINKIITQIKREVDALCEFRPPDEDWAIIEGIKLGIEKGKQLGRKEMFKLIEQRKEALKNVKKTLPKDVKEGAISKANFNGAWAELYYLENQLKKRG